MLTWPRPYISLSGIFTRPEAKENYYFMSSLIMNRIVVKVARFTEYGTACYALEYIITSAVLMPL